MGKTTDQVQNGSGVRSSTKNDGMAAALERLAREARDYARDYVGDRETSCGKNEALAEIDAEHPLHEAVVAVQAFHGGKLPSPPWRHWRLLLRTSRADDATPEEYDAAIEAAGAIADWAAAELERLGASAPAIPLQGLVPGALAELVGVSPTTINRKARAAGVKPPAAGQKAKPYSLREVRLILLELVAKSSRDCSGAAELLSHVDSALASADKKAKQKPATARH